MSNYIDRFYNNFKDYQFEDLLNQQDRIAVKEILKFAKYTLDHKIRSDSTHNELEMDIQGLVEFIGNLRSTKSSSERDRIGRNYRPKFEKIRTAFYELIKNDDLNRFGEFIDNREDYERDVEVAHSAKEQIEQVISDHRKQFDEFMNLTKERLANVGILEYEQVFGKESKGFEVSAWLWFTALVGALTALVVIGVWYLPQIPDEANGGKIAEIIFRKIVIVTGLFYLVALFSRNYKASMHNALVNKHRQNALKTFQIFIKSVQNDDAQTKNAVLLKATETIFGNQPSGFLPDSGDGDMSPKIIEIFKNFPTSAK